MHLQLDYHRITPLFAVFTLRRRPKALPSKFFWEAFALHQPRPGKIHSYFQSQYSTQHWAYLPTPGQPAEVGWLVISLYSSP